MSNLHSETYRGKNILKKRNKKQPRFRQQLHQLKIGIYWDNF